jgi:hypothetical protein
MAVEIRERQLARALGLPPKPPKPRRFRTLQPRTSLLKSPFTLEMWDTSGKQTVNRTGTGNSRRLHVELVDTAVGNLKDPTYHGYRVSEYCEGGRVDVYYQGAYAGKKYYEIEGPIHGESLGFTSNSYDYWPYVKYHLDAGVYNKALEALNEQTRGTVDLSIDIAQAGQTARMLRQVDEFAKRASDHVAGRPDPWKHGPNLKRVHADPLKYLRFAPGIIKTGSRLLANRWLEWQYGIRPLLSTIHECGEKSLNVVLNKTRRFKAVYVQPQSPVKGWPVVVNTIPYTTTLKVNGKVGCCFRIELQTPGASLAEYSSLNPVSIAWELVPFSFVVDWFYDLGSFFRNAETAFLYNNKFVRGSASRFSIADCAWEVTESKILGNGTLMVPDYWGNARLRSFGRFILSSYPSPYPPSFKAELGSSRLLSAAALLRGILR